jgi:hypothetical protein
MKGNALLARLAIDSIIMDFFIPLDATYQLTDQAIIDRLRELELSYQGKIKEARLFMHKMEAI